MLHLIPRPLHRLLYRAAHFAKCRYLGLRGGMVRGASVIGRDGQGRVLLVRHAYGSRKWSFPGGGVGRGEEPVLAAKREFAEELGCEVGALESLGEIDEPFYGATNRVFLFTGLVLGNPEPDGRELTHAQYFYLHELPGELSQTVAGRLARLQQG